MKQAAKVNIFAGLQWLLYKVFVKFHRYYKPVTSGAGF